MATTWILISLHLASPLYTRAYCGLKKYKKFSGTVQHDYKLIECVKMTSLCLLLPLGRVRAANVGATGTGATATGIDLTDLIAAKDGKQTKSPREASAESRKSAAGGEEMAGLRLNLCAASPAWQTVGTEEAGIGEAETEEAEIEEVGTRVVTSSQVWTKELRVE